MTLKSLQRSDIEELWRIKEKFYNFPFPDITQPIYCIQNVIRDDKGNIVLGSILKLTAEGIFITNKDLPEITRMKAILLANKEISKQAINLGLEDVHIFAESDDNYIKILRKLGWKDCTGYPMVRMKE